MIATTQANNASSSATAAAASAASAAAITNISSVQTFTNPLAQAVRVAMTAAASGSNGIQVLDNVQADFGTGNFSVLVQKLIANTRPTANEILYNKHNGTEGVIVTLLTTGILRLTLNATTFDSTSALTSTTNVIPVITIPVVRETTTSAGSVTFYVDGVQLGTALAISARVEKIVNGTFDSDITGWTLATSSGGTITWNAGKMRVERTSSVTAAYQEISLAAGETLYCSASATFISGTATIDAQLALRSSAAVSGPALALGTELINSASGVSRLSYYSATAQTVYLHTYLSGANGIYDFDTITSLDTYSVDNASNLYLLGTSTTRTQGDHYKAIIYNRALSAAEVLSLAVNGPALADIGASQTNLITGDSVNFEGGTVGSWAANTGNGVTSVAVNTVSPISGTYDLLTVTNGLVNSGIQLNIGSVVIGEKYRLVFDYKGATSNAWGIIFRNNANPASGSVWADTVVGGTGWQPATAGQLVYEFTCSLTTGSGRIHIVNSVVDTIQLDNFVLVNLGITGLWNAADAQSNTGQIFDSSGNKNHALLPAAGATIIGRPTSQQQQVRWTNTWAGTNELQYIGGVNQAILPANAYIESIVGTVSGATPHDIIIGDGSDTDRYVTITTGLAAGTTSFTLANRTTDGTNLKLTVDPDTNATMSIAWVITYTTLE